MSDTIFGKIIRREIPAPLLHDDALCIAIADINPQAPTHLLVIPKKPIATLNDLTEQDKQVVGHLFVVGRDLMAARGITDFRAVINCGVGAGQTVFHLHLHLLGGRAMTWPPG